MRRQKKVTIINGLNEGAMRVEDRKEHERQREALIDDMNSAGPPMMQEI